MLLVTGVGFGAVSSVLYADDLEFSSGVGCLKLTTLLFNVLLNFKTLILQIHCYFCCKNV